MLLSFMFIIFQIHTQKHMYICIKTYMLVSPVNISSITIPLAPKTVAGTEEA